MVVYMNPRNIGAQRVYPEPPAIKPSNPKDRLGILKVCLSVIPFPVLWELGLAMLEGALKYGRHNYRVIGVRASVYYDAVMARHMPSWWEGEDNDPDSDISHITKAIASLVVLRDAMIRGNWVDDRPPKTDPQVLKDMNAKVKALLDKYPDQLNPIPNWGRTMFDLKAFIEESNRIEGIVREATYEEIQATTAFLDKPRLVTSDVEDLVDVYAPGNRLRDAYGVDVVVGGYYPPRGAPEIRVALDTLLARISDKDARYGAWQAHIAYEMLHPFTDGNGRSGRAIWLWQMRTAPLGFLHKFYYQTLSQCEGAKRG